MARGGFGDQYWDRKINGTQRMQFNNVDRSASSQAGQVGAAAGLSTLPSVNRSVKENSPDWGAIGEKSIDFRSQVKQAAWEVDANVRAKEIWADGMVEAAKIRGQARADAAQSKGQSDLFKGAMGGLFKIGTAALMASDESIKNNIESIDDALSVLRGLKPVSFYYNEEYSCNPERQHYGFIAQEYAKVMPDATYYDEEIGKLAIDTGELIGLLVRSVQQLETKVTRLEAANALVGVKQ